MTAYQLVNDDAHRVMLTPRPIQRPTHKAMNPDVPLLPILVADDSPTDLFFLQRRLQSAGIKNPLQHVEDGIEARRLLERICVAPLDPAAPRLLFLDLKMPRMDGFELLGWIRDRGLFDWLTVAVVSTSDEPSDIERAQRLGAHRFLVKYPRPSELAEVVGLAVSRAFGAPPLPSSFPIRHAS